MGANTHPESNRGSFLSTGSHLQCTAKSKRSQKQCRGPAILNSPTQKCRMHGGKSSTIGAANKSFKTGRSSAYLPAKLGELYEESLSNPDLLEMSSHIALLESRMHQILGESTSDNPVPRWEDMQEAVNGLAAAVEMKGGNREKMIAEATEKLSEITSAGAAWDSTWGQVIEIMDNIRKLTDVEIKRKKELNQMVPVERVIILMVALADTVKRCVSKPEEIMKVQSEFARIVRSDTSLDGKTVKMGVGVSVVGSEVIDVG